MDLLEIRLEVVDLPTLFLIKHIFQVQVPDLNLTSIVSRRLVLTVNYTCVLYQICFRQLMGLKRNMNLSVSFDNRMVAVQEGSWK